VVPWQHAIVFSEARLAEHGCHGGAAFEPLRQPDCADSQAAPKVAEAVSAHAPAESAADDDVVLFAAPLVGPSLGGRNFRFTGCESCELLAHPYLIVRGDFSVAS